MFHDPGLCIKCFKVNTNEKFFINICQTDAIPSPENITEDELNKILNSDEPSSYRIPMSISEPRTTKDKSGNPADACDIAINPEFFRKCEVEIFFRDFLVAVILEGLSEKYNIQIKADNWIVLRNRKFIGQLVPHRVQNRDVKTVYDSYKNPNATQKRMIEELTTGNAKSKKLIEEINPRELKAMKEVKKQYPNSPRTPEEIKQSIAQANSIVPRHKFIGKVRGSDVVEIIAEFFLPKCITAEEIILDIGEDRVLIECMKHGYLFDKFVDYSIDQDNVVAKFNKATKMLNIRMPVAKTEPYSS
ncbi:PIH1 domain-containing protein 1 isoform X2 [Hermetia illucens]|uniref:PIH1 domain-containing protein 1 isoform X2 n=1 Tax=Hermetia illucens TaxID=343691 RepID=UPI0018CC3DE9|nr:PIH1 domain-containing protein 1 isoform X2 [Hermetia illucens]